MRFQSFIGHAPLLCIYVIPAGRNDGNDAGTQGPVCCALCVGLFGGPLCCSNKFVRDSPKMFSIMLDTSMLSSTTHRQLLPEHILKLSLHPMI